MSVQRPQKGAFNFKMRPEVESRFREGAVNQAKDTINRRVDELGLREAAVTVRDEDIIIEVPGEDERTFKEIRDIISQTARLEFKILDDSNDFLGKATKGDEGGGSAQGRHPRDDERAGRSREDQPHPRRARSRSSPTSR